MTPVETMTVDAALLLPPLTNGAEPPGLAVDARGRRKPPVGGYTIEIIERVRALVVRTNLPLVDIAAESGVSPSTIKNWVRRYGWPRPDGAPPLSGPRVEFDPAVRRARLAVRLYRVLGRQLTGLERRARDDGGERAEKDARTLGVLAKTLETLMELDRDDGAKVREPEPVDRGYLRLELARKIAAWAEEEEEPGKPDPAADRSGSRILGEGLG